MYVCGKLVEQFDHPSSKLGYLKYVNEKRIVKESEG